MSKEQYSKHTGERAAVREENPKIKLDGLDAGLLLDRRLIGPAGWIESRKPSLRVHLVRYLAPVIGGMIHNISKSEARPLLGQERYETIWPPDRFGDVYMVPPYWSFIVRRWKLPDFYLTPAAYSVSNIVVLKKLSCESQCAGYNMPWKEYTRMLEEFACVVWAKADWAKADFEGLLNALEEYQSRLVNKLLAELKEMKKALTISLACYPDRFDLGLAACKPYAKSSTQNMKLVIHRLHREFDLVHTEVKGLLQATELEVQQNMSLVEMNGDSGCMCGGVCICEDTDQLHPSQRLLEQRRRQLRTSGQRIDVIEDCAKSLKAKLNSGLATGDLDVVAWQPCLENMDRAGQEMNPAIADYRRFSDYHSRAYKILLGHRENLFSAFRFVLQNHGGEDWLKHFNGLERDGGFAHPYHTWCERTSRNESNFRPITAFPHVICREF